MSKEQVALFRKNFRENHIPSWYSGILHLLFNGTVLVGLCLFLYSRVANPRWWEFLTIPLTLLIGNLAVFVIHRYPLHRMYKFVHNFTYKVHSKWHHQFYTDEFIIYEGTKDFYILFFPPTVVLGFSLVYIPTFYFILSSFIPMNYVYFFLGSSTLYFLLYEVFHYVSHLPKDHVVLKFGPFMKMWKHHVIHHNTRLMHKHNFNIVFPFCDYIFGTTYRGELESVEN